MNLFWNIVLVFFIYKFINRLCINVFGKPAIEMLVSLIVGKTLMQLQDESLKNGSLKLNYQALFDQLVKVTGKKPLELFLIARTESGFGWTDDNVERHFNEYIRSIKLGKEAEFPNYVEMFLDNGRDYIINS